MSDSFNMTLQARISGMRKLAAMVEAFGEAHSLPMRTNFVINLALEELVTNTVVHGRFENEAKPEIDIQLGIERGAVVLVLESNGGMFDPTQDTQADTASELQARPVGGLGLHLVKSQADRISYEYISGTNRLTLEYDLAPVS